MTEPLIISDFESGIADSPHKGIGLLRNVDIEAFTGSVKVRAQLYSLFHTTLSSTCSGVAATDVLTLDSGTVPLTATAVKPTTTVAGVTANTVYFINKISSSTFYLYDTITNAKNGTATGRIDITNTTSFTIATVDPGTINHMTVNVLTQVNFALDSNGRVWYQLNSTSQMYLVLNSVLDNAKIGSAALAGANGNGMVLFLNSDKTALYLIVFRDNLVDIINVTIQSNIETPSWTNAWNFGGAVSDTALVTASGTNNRHHAIVSSLDTDTIYFTDDRYIGRIRELTVFNPADTATYSGNNLALDTPLNEILVHLEELNTNLLAAGSTFNRIYPWDRVSNSYNLPLIVPENNVYRLKNLGNLVYILAGGLGNIYTTQGTYVKHFKKIPEHVTNNSGTLQANPISWGGIEIINGALIFGMSVQTSGNSGVYKLYPDGRLVIDQIPTTAGNATAFIAQNNFYLIGFASGVNAHTSIGGVISRYSAFEGVIQSQFYRVATKTGKGTLSTLEVVIAQPVSTGNVRIKYRVDTSSSFGNFPNGETSYAADGSTTTFRSDIGLIDLENIQVQAEIDGNVELIEIRLLP